MNEKEVTERINIAMGEALHAGLLIPALWMTLLKSGVVSQEQSVTAVDTSILMLEKARGAGDQGDNGAIDHALSRLESVLESLTTYGRSA